MANDKKNADVSSLLSDEEVDINSLISDEEVEISPKQDAPSANGGGNGAQNTPSSSSPLELSSWTTEANPYQSKGVQAPLSNQKYEPSNFGEILEKAKIGVINPDLDIPMGRPATEKPKQDIDLLTKRTNVVRKLRDEEINKAKQLQLGLEQLKQKGAALNEQYKANPTPELEAELNQTVKDLQDTERAYNRAAFAQDVYEKRIVQTSDSIKKLANDKVPTNVWEGLYSGIKGNVDSWEESYDLVNMGKEEQIQYAKDQATKAPTIEASGGGGVSQMIGGVLPDIATAIGFSLVGLPAAGATTVAARQGAQQASEDFVRVFNEVKANGLPSGQKDAKGNDIMREASDDEAYDLAVKSAGIGAATGFVEGMVGVAGSGKLVGALANKAKTQLGKKVAEKALDTAIDAGVAGTMQVSRNVFDRYQGLDTKITEGVAENMAGEALLSAPINTISGVKEYSKAKKETAVREVFKAINESKSNPYELQKLQSNLDVLKNQGLISDIDYNELNKKAEDYIKVVETIPTEVKDKQKAADLIIERDELEAKKESVDKAFQKPIDEKINAINEELVQLATPEAEAGLTPKTETDGKERREEEAKNVLTPTTETAGVVEAAPIVSKQGESIEEKTLLEQKGENKQIETVLNEQKVENKEDVNIQQPMGESKADVGAVGDVAKEELPKEEVEPLRQLGTGANVYFETNKHRVNDDLKSGKVLLNIGSKEDEVPMANIQFDSALEAVAVAKELERIYPKGVPSAVLIDKVVEDIRTKIKNTHNEKNPTPTTVNDQVPQPSVEVNKDDNKVEVKSKVNQKFKAAKKVQGEATTIEMPNGETREAEYMVVESDDILASHNETSFSDTEGYPKTADGRNANSRNYKGDKSAQLKVNNDAKNLKPSIVISDAATPDTGVPIISEDGIVVSGNGRTMAIKLSQNIAPEKYEAYKADLAKRAAKFGLDPNEVAKMKKPILVKVDRNVKDYSVKTFDEYNGKFQKEESPIDKAIKRSSIIQNNEKLKERILSIIGRHETMTDLFENKSDRKELFDLLVANDIILSQETPKYLQSNGELTPDGKDLVNDILIATILSPETLEATSNVKAFRNKIINALPVLIANYKLGENSLETEINDAIVLQSKIASMGSQEEFWTHLRQMGMFDVVNPNTVIINRLINGGANNFKKFVMGYNKSMEVDENNLFGSDVVLTKQQVIDNLKQSNLNENEKQVIANLEELYAANEQKRPIGNVEVVGGNEAKESPKSEQEVTLKTAKQNPINEPKNAVGVARIFRKLFNFSPAESVLAARLFDAKATFMAKVKGISKEDYYKEYWFDNEGKGGLNQSRKGSWTKEAAKMKRLISMYKKADSSTPIHEILGHDFLDRIIELGGSVKEFEEDLNTIVDEYIKATGSKTKKSVLLNDLKNFDVENNQNANGKAIHEWFAKSAESYMKNEKGAKAGTKLAQVFEKFRKYLSEIYNQMTGDLIPPSKPMVEIFRKAFGTENFDIINDYANEQINETQKDLINNKGSKIKLTDEDINEFERLRNEQGLAQDENVVTYEKLFKAALYYKQKGYANVHSIGDELKLLFPSAAKEIDYYLEDFRDIFVPRGERISQTGESAYNSELVDEEVKKELGKRGAYTYKPQSLKVAVNKVKALIDEMGLEQAIEAWKNGDVENNMPESSQPVFAAIVAQRTNALIKQLKKGTRADKEEAKRLSELQSDIIEKHIQKGEEAGRTLNAYKVMAMMSADGIMRFWKKKFNNLNKETKFKLKQQIDELMPKLEKAYKDAEYLFFESASNEELAGRYKEELEQKDKEIAELTKRKANYKPKETVRGGKRNDAKAPRKIDSTELKSILERRKKSQGLGQDLEGLNDDSKLGVYIIQNKPTGLVKFVKEWNKLTGEKQDVNSLRDLYEEVRDFSVKENYYDSDWFDSDADIDEAVNDYLENKVKVEEQLAKKELEKEILKAKKSEENAATALTKAVISDAKKQALNKVGKKDYLTELLGYLKNKAKDTYEKGTTKKLTDPFEQMKYAMEMLNDSNGRKIWEDSQKEIAARIDNDNSLSQTEKDSLKNFLQDYETTLFDQLLSENKLLKNIQKVLIEDGNFVKGNSVDWKGIIVDAKGKPEAVKEIIKGILGDKLTNLGYSQAQIDNMLDAISRKYDNVIKEKKVEIADAQFNKIANPPQRKKKTIAKGKIQNLIEMENSGLLSRSGVEQEIGKWLGVKEMTNQKWAKLRELAEKVEESPEGNERDLAIDEMAAFVRLNSIGRYAEIYAALTYTGMLGRPITTLKNATGIIEPLLTMFYKAFYDPNYAKAMLSYSTRRDFIDVMKGGQVQGSRLDVQVGKDGLPYTNVLKGLSREQGGFFKKLASKAELLTRPLGAFDALSQAMVTGGEDYRQLVEQKIEQGKTLREARKEALEEMTNQTTYASSLAEAEKEFATRGIVPTQARLERRAFEIMRNTYVTDMMKEISTLASLEQAYKSKIDANAPREETNRGIFTLLGMVAQKMVRGFGEGAGVVARGAAKGLGAKEATVKSAEEQTSKIVQMKLMPFIRGISNVMQSGIDKVAGIATGSIGIANELRNYKPSTPEEAAIQKYMIERHKNQIGKSAATMIIGGLFYYLLLDEDDEEKKKKLEQGIIPNGIYPAGEIKWGNVNNVKRFQIPQASMVVNGRVYPLNYMGTLGIGSLMVANGLSAYKSSQEKEKPKDPSALLDIPITKQIASSTWNTILNMSTFQGTSELMATLDPTSTKTSSDYFEREALKSLALAIPFVGTAQQVTNLSKVAAGKNKAQTAIGFKEKAYKELGLDGLMYDRPVVDYRGREIPMAKYNVEGSGGLDAITSKWELDPLDKYLIDIKYNPKLDKRTDIVDADNNAMSKEDYYDYSVAVGKQFGQFLKDNEFVIINKEFTPTKSGTTSNEQKRKKIADYQQAVEKINQAEYKYKNGKIDLIPYQSQIREAQETMKIVAHEFHKTPSLP